MIQKLDPRQLIWKAHLGGLALISQHFASNSYGELIASDPHFTGTTS